MDVYAVEPMPQPIENLELQGVKVAQVAAGWNHGAALSEVGEVYVWGGKSGFLEPSLVTDLPEHCVWIGAGNNFTVCLTASGSLITFSHGGSSGGAGMGCLGRGEGAAKGDRRPDVVNTFEQLEDGEKILDVQVGWTHVGVVVGREE